MLNEYDEDEDGSHAPHAGLLEVKEDEDDVDDEYELEEVGSQFDHGSLDDVLDEEELIEVDDQSAHE